MSIPAERRLSLEATEEFQKIYEEEFGKPISDSEAQLMAIQLIRFFSLLTQPDSTNAT
jgi:hypothetical protein